MTPRRARALLPACSLACVLAGTLAMQALYANDATPVQVVETARTASTQALRLTGTVTSEQNAALSPRVSGLIAVMHVDAGDRVKQGGALMDLDAALARLELGRAEAALAEAAARLAEAVRVRDDTRNLVRENHVPRTQAEASEAEVRIQEAVVARMQAELRQQEEIVRRHRLVAPFSGVVSRRVAEVGEWVQTGSPVLELVAIDRLRIDVQAPQERFYEIRADAPVEVQLDALPGRTFTGSVAAKVPVKDPQARTFLVRIGVRNVDNLITPGMSARVGLPLGDGAPALVLPRDGILRHPDGSASAWIVERDGAGLRATRRAVRLGRTQGDSVEVLEGIEPGNRVIVRGNEALREGQAVRLVP